MNLTQYKKGQTVEVYLSAGPFYTETEVRKPINPKPGDDLIEIREMSSFGITGVVEKTGQESITISVTERAYTDVFEISKAHVAGIKTVELSKYGKEKSAQMKRYHLDKNTKRPQGKGL